MKKGIFAKAVDFIFFLIRFSENFLKVDLKRT